MGAESLAGALGSTFDASVYCGAELLELSAIRHCSQAPAHNQLIGLDITGAHAAQQLRHAESAIVVDAKRIQDAGRRVIRPAKDDRVRREVVEVARVAAGHLREI